MKLESIDQTNQFAIRQELPGYLVFKDGEPHMQTADRPPQHFCVFNDFNTFHLV